MSAWRTRRQSIVRPPLEYAIVATVMATSLSYAAFSDSGRVGAANNMIISLTSESRTMLSFFIKRKSPDSTRCLCKWFNIAFNARRLLPKLTMSRDSCHVFQK